MTNMEEKEVIRGLIRLTLELRFSGTPHPVLQKALRRLVPIAWCPVGEVQKAVDWPTRVAEAWTRAYDARLGMEVESLRVLEVLMRES